MFTRMIARIAVLAMMGLGIAVASSTPAQANGVCPDNRVCLYQCWLAESCSAYVVGLFTLSGCNDVSPVFTKSVKNTSGRKYFVYKNASCTGAHSVIWPESQGNMNNEWLYFKGMQRTVI